MLVELAVHDLGVIADLSLVLGEGLTAVTGETGAGKTLVVEAIELLVGGRADATLVRPGAAEARVEGRFVVDGDETVLCRVVSREGRSRAYVDGRMATVGSLAELGAALVDLHGQHAHQSLLSTTAQRAALDRFAGTDLGPLRRLRERLGEIDELLAVVGGDGRARAREADLLRYQLDEIGGAALTGPDEDERLAVQEAVLADATAHREAAAAAHDAIEGDGGATDLVAGARARLDGRAPFVAAAARLGALEAELRDVAADLRDGGDAIDDEPGHLEAVQARRRLLADLRRKYGDTVGEVIAFGEEAATRLAELERSDQRALELEAERAQVVDQVAAAAATVAATRGAAAGPLAAAVEAHLGSLALPRARLAVQVGAEAPGDDVQFLFSANAGEPLAPLAKVASGGELARAMLALRLVLTAAPPTLVFDEVDAGIGGEAALAVAAALAQVGVDHQVLVVTHLPQVAAAALSQVRVAKEEVGERTTASARSLDHDERVVELSRMLSGSPGSESARRHAEELLESAAGPPPRLGGVGRRSGRRPTRARR